MIRAHLAIWSQISSPLIRVKTGYHFVILESLRKCVSDLYCNLQGLAQKITIAILCWNKIFSFFEERNYLSRTYTFVKSGNTQYLFHLTASGQFINKFIQVSSLQGQWRLDLLDPVFADQPFDHRNIGMELGFLKKLLKSHSLIDQALQFLFIKTG